MSIAAMSVIWDSMLTGVDKLIMLAIADAGDDHGRNAWPALATLATRASVDVRTVQRRLRAMVDQGLLTVDTNAGGPLHHRGNRRPNLYEIDLDAVVRLGATGATPGVTPNSRVRGDKNRVRGDKKAARGDRPVLKSAAERPTERPTEQTPPAPAAAAPAPSTVDQHPGETPDHTRFADFWAAYPKQEDEIRARLAWIDATRTTPAAVITDGARRYADYVKRQRYADRYIASPVTWLRGQRWNDTHTPAAAPATDRHIWGDALDGLIDTHTTPTDGHIWGDAWAVGQ